MILTSIINNYQLHKASCSYVHQLMFNNQLLFLYTVNNEKLTGLKFGESIPINLFGGRKFTELQACMDIRLIFVIYCNKVW